MLIIDITKFNLKHPILKDVGRGWSEASRGYRDKTHPDLHNFNSIKHSHNNPEFHSICNHAQVKLTTTETKLYLKIHNGWSHKGCVFCEIQP